MLCKRCIILWVAFIDLLHIRTAHHLAFLLSRYPSSHTLINSRVGRIDRLCKSAIQEIDKHFLNVNLLRI